MEHISPKTTALWTTRNAWQVSVRQLLGPALPGHWLYYPVRLAPALTLDDVCTQLAQRAVPHVSRWRRRGTVRIRLAWCAPDGAQGVRVINVSWAHGEVTWTEVCGA